MNENRRDKQFRQLARAGAAFAVTFGVGISVAAVLGLAAAISIPTGIATSAVVAYFAHR